MKLRLVWFGTALAVVLYGGAWSGAQQPTDPPAKEKVPAKGDAILVKGCLDGPTLQSIETSMMDETGHLATPLTYQLKGDKKLLRQLRDEHNFKVVEVKGILKSNLPQDSAIRGKTVGKTKITFGVGASSTQGAGPDLNSALPGLEVKSYESPGARCNR